MDTKSQKTIANLSLCQRTLESEIKAIWTICMRNLKIEIRYPINFILSQIFFIGDVAAFILLGYVSGPKGGFQEYVGTLDFVSFFVVGGALWTFWKILIDGIGGSLREEQLCGTLEVNYTCPTRRLDLLIGYSLSFLVESVLWLSIYFVLGTIIFGMTLNTTIPNVVMSMFIFLLVILASSGFSFLMAGIVFRFKEPGILSTFLFHPLSYFSGTYFTIKAMPEGIRWISYLIPTSYSIDCLRSLLLGTETFMPLNIEVLILLLFAAILPILGMSAFTQLEKRALQKGDLATY